MKTQTKFPPPPRGYRLLSTAAQKLAAEPKRHYDMFFDCGEWHVMEDLGPSHMGKNAKFPAYCYCRKIAASAGAGRRRVTVNGIVCPSCGDRIWSRHRHDYRMCKCGEVAIGGGRDYTRIAFKKTQPKQVRMRVAVGGGK